MERGDQVPEHSRAVVVRQACAELERSLTWPEMIRHPDIPEENQSWFNAIA
jgi:hypothetical protein